MKHLSVTLFVSALTTLGILVLIRPELRRPEGEEKTPIVVEEVVEPCPEERVIDLPEDGANWHTILILRPDWRNLPAERRAEAMFHSEPLLVSLKHQTHWHLITTDQPEFAPFRSLVTATPCLIVERANGEVVYRESGPELGKHPHDLTHAIRREVERHCPDGRCLPLHPVPRREEERPFDDEIPSVLRVGPSPHERGRIGLIAIVTAVGAALGGIAYQWRKAG